MNKVNDKYPLLQQVVQYDADALEKILEYCLGGSGRSSIWEYVHDYANALNFPYKKAKALFLELIEYWLREGVMKFLDTEVEIDFETEKKIMWKYRSVEDTLKYIDKYMPNKPTSDDNAYFIWSVFPVPSYWYDGSDPEYPVAEWEDAD